MRGSLLIAAAIGLMASNPATAQLPTPRRASRVPRRLYTSADDERLAKAKAKLDRKAAKRAAQKEKP